MKGWKKINQATGNQKQAGIAILLPGETDFKSKSIKRDKERHYILIKGLIHQEDTTIINIYAPSIRPSRYIQQILLDLKGEIDYNTMILGAFNTPLSSMERSSRQKIYKDTSELKHTLEKMYLTDINVGHFTQLLTEYTFSSAHETFSRPYIGSQVKSQ